MLNSSPIPALDVQHLAPHCEDCLEAAVPALNGGTGGGVALDDVDFAERGISLVAVLQFVGHLAALQSGFAADGFPGLACRFPGTVGHHRLFQNGLCGGRVFFKVFRQLFVHDGINQRPDIGVAELLLGLAFKLCLR